MELLNWKKIIGIRVKENGEKSYLENTLMKRDSSCKYIEFESVGEIDSLISELNDLKKGFLRNDKEFSR